jgi:hypothetical protein
MALYVTAATFFGWQMPLYLIPTKLASASLSPDRMPSLFLPYLGHFIGSTISGGIAAGFTRLLSRWSPVSAYPETWDAFVRSCVPNHWVVVSLTNGVVYAGKIHEADVSVSQRERDIILEEPALYDSSNKTYIALNYQCVFLQGAVVYSVGVVHDPGLDRRLTKVGESLFEEGQHGKQGPSSQQQVCS